MPAVLLAVFVFGACGEGGPLEDTVVSDSAGVTILTHRGSDVPADLAFHEEFRLGGSETRPEESFYRVHAGSIGIDGAGRLHVLDASIHQVVVFDDEGRHLRSVGGPGDGPGEIGIPGGLTVFAEGGFGVLDLSRRGMVRFGPEGEPGPTLPFPPTFFGGSIHVEGEALVAPGRAPENGGPAGDELLHIAGGDTLRLARVDGAETHPIRLESCGMQFSGMAPVFWPTLRWSARNGTVAVVTSAEYDVVVLEEGREARRIRRGIAPREATDALAVREQGEGMQVRLEAGTVVCDPAEVVEQRGVAARVPTIARVVVAPDGGIWVQRGGVRDEPRPIDLFDAEGRYRGTLPAGSPFPLAFFPDGRIAAAETDDLDVTRVVVYRMETG